MAMISNEQFVAEFEDFVDTAKSNKDELSYSDEDEAQGTALKTELISELNALQVAQTALDARKASFSEKRKTASGFKSSRERFFASNPAVSAETRAKLNITKSVSGSSRVVAQPLDLSVEGFASGINTCKWKRNGNPSQRKFTVECRVGETGAWLIAGTTSKTVFNHKNQTPGTKIYYRVYAHTDDEQSSHSNTAVVYA